MEEDVHNSAVAALRRFPQRRGASAGGSSEVNGAKVHRRPPLGEVQTTAQQPFCPWGTVIPRKGLPLNWGKSSGPLSTTLRLLTMPSGDLFLAEIRPQIGLLRFTAGIPRVWGLPCPKRDFMGCARHLVFAQPHSGAVQSPGSSPSQLRQKPFLSGWSTFAPASETNSDSDSERVSCDSNEDWQSPVPPSTKVHSPPTSLRVTLKTPRRTKPPPCAQQSKQSRRSQLFRTRDRSGGEVEGRASLEKDVHHSVVAHVCRYPQRCLASAGGSSEARS